MSRDKVLPITALVLTVPALLVLSQPVGSSAGSPGASTATAGTCKVKGPLPDRRCTPGAVFRKVTAGDVCTPGYSKRVRKVSESLKEKVYLSYGIRHHRSYQYEIDHLVSLELGGDNAQKNLWPEAAAPRPGYHEKDKLENRLHAEVCERKLSLSSAQREIRSNWSRAYRGEFF